MTASDLQRDYQRAIARRASQTRVQCPPASAIEALAAGEGAESDRLTTLDHVMACPHCQREFELLRAIHAAGRARIASIRPRWYALAAAAVLAVALSLVTMNRNSTVMRGSGAQDSVPRLLTPIGDVDVSASRRFVWHPFPGAAQYRIEVLESGGQVRASASVVDTTWLLADSLAFGPGEELHWTVEAVLPDARRLRSTIAAFRVR